MTELHQILLVPPGSGRGVRYKLLSPNDNDQIQIDAAILSPPMADAMRYRIECMRLGVKRMICEVTREAGYADGDALNDERVQWIKVNQQMLEPGPSEWAYDKLFTAIDDSVLKGIYMRLTEASGKMVEDIVGKARKVSMG